MKKKSRFWRALGIYCAVFAVVIAAALGVLWKYMSSYERSRPENAAETYIETSGAQYWSQGAADAVGAGEFDVSGATLEDYGVTIDMDAMTVASDGQEGESKYYSVSSAGSEIARLTLVKGESVGFGMNAWVVTDCAFQAGRAVTLRVIVPEGAAVEINGVAVKSSYITSESAEIECEPKVDFDVCPAGTEYTVAGLHGPIELSVADADGNILEPLDTTGSVVQYAPSGDIAFELLVPEGATVLANGKDITGRYPGDADALTAGFESYLSAPVELYACQGLLCEPEFEVTAADGTALSEETRDGELICYVPGAAKTLPEEQETFALDFTRAYIVFSANLDNETESNFRALDAYLLSGTELEKRMEDTVENIAWAKTNGLDYVSLEASGCIPLGDNCFVCTVAYEITNHAVNGTREVTASFRLLVVSDGGKWKAANMITVSGE